MKYLQVAASAVTMYLDRIFVRMPIRIEKRLT